MGRYCENLEKHSRVVQRRALVQFFIRSQSMQKKPLPISRLITLAFCFCTLAAMICCPPLNAQTSYGGISGVVLDPSAAAIADAEVTLTNTATGEKQVQRTSPDGL